MKVIDDHNASKVKWEQIQPGECFKFDRSPDVYMKLTDDCTQRRVLKNSVNIHTGDLYNMYVNTACYTLVEVTAVVKPYKPEA